MVPAICFVIQIPLFFVLHSLWKKFQGPRARSRARGFGKAGAEQAASDSGAVILH